MPPISLSIDSPSDLEIATLRAAVAALPGGAPSSLAPASAPPSGPVAPPAGMPLAFPADPGSAPFPSPENSTSVVLGSALSGAPYLRDAAGVIYQLAITGTPPTLADPGGRLHINGVLWIGFGDATGAHVSEILLRGGRVYWQLSSGQWQTMTGTGSAANATPPAPVAVAPGAAAPIVAMPPDPSPAAVAPGSSGNVILAGPSQTIKTLADAIAAAKPGDTVRLDPGAVFTESVLIGVPIVLDGQGGLDGVGGAVVDGSSFTSYARQLGGLVPLTDVIINGLEIRGFGMAEKSSGGTGGIRPGAACFITVRNCHIHDCQNGLSSGGFAVVWNVSNSLIELCGLGDGQSHNVYASTGTVRALFQSVASTGPRGGHALKSRAMKTDVVGGSYDADDETPIDFPQGSAVPFSITGAEIGKSVNAANHGLFGYALESQQNGAPGGTITGCTINARCPSPLIQVAAGTVTLSNNTFPGNKVAAAGAGTVLGL